MQPLEHYVKAEEIIRHVAEMREQFRFDDYENPDVMLASITQYTLEAQVHATLAQIKMNQAQAATMVHPQRCVQILDSGGIIVCDELEDAAIHKPWYRGIYKHDYYKGPNEN